MTGPRNQKVGANQRHYQPGQIAYGPDFQSDLMQQLANLQPKLAPGLSFAPPYLGPDAFTLTVVPEPGTLVPAITGSLVLVAFAYRERRRQRRADGLPSGHLG